MNHASNEIKRSAENVRVRRRANRRNYSAGVGRPATARTVVAQRFAQELVDLLIDHGDLPVGVEIEWDNSRVGGPFVRRGATLTLHMSALSLERALACEQGRSYVRSGIVALLMHVGLAYGSSADLWAHALCVWSNRDGQRVAA